MAAHAQAPWVERISLERELAEHLERYQPRSARAGVALSASEATAAFVDGDGARLTLGGGTVRIGVVSVGRDGAPVALVDARPTVHGPEVRRELARGVTEWWRALPSGLEHGVTVVRRPAGRGPLRIDVSVEGADVRAHSDDAVELVRNGVHVAPYAHLFVTDANEARMPARMRVVEGRIRIEVDDTDARYPLIVDPLVQEALLVPSDAVSDDVFGNAVALSADGSRALLASSLDDTPSGSRAGSVRVFRRSGASWTEEATLLAPAVEVNFGSAVAISADGTRALIGALNDRTPAGGSAGSAWVFLRSGTTWTQEAMLTPSGARGLDRFGSAVALSSDGTRALVGAPGAPGLISDPGTAHVFLRSGTLWTEEATLTETDVTTDDHFGSSVALSGDGTRAIVGANVDDTAAGADAGSVRIFARSGSSWAREVTLPGGTAGGWFGTSVAMSDDGSRALVGASRDASVRVLVRSGTSWTDEATLRVAARDFGAAVALSATADRAVVGAPEGGTLRVLERTGTTWTETSALVGADGGDFGYAVAISSDGTRAIAGGMGYSADLARFRTGCGVVYALRAGGADGTACATASACTSGSCVDGVCCDSACGGGLADDCEACAFAAGAAMDGACGALRAAVAGITSCRPSVSGCDVDEVCSESSRACPPDSIEPAGTICRSAFDACDMRETCNGRDATCPPDLIAGSTAVCRPSTGPCDAAETCTGSDPRCPPDGLSPSGTVCRASADACDAAETCDGSSLECPMDVFAADGAPCDDDDLCNGDERCRSGACARDGALDCNDGDLCTADACDALTGCSNTPVDGCCDTDDDCDDRNPCTEDLCTGTGATGTCRNEGIEGCDFDAGPPMDAGGDGATGSADGGSPPSAEGGCSCRATGSSDGGPTPWLATLLALAFLRRRSTSRADARRDA